MKKVEVPDTIKELIEFLKSNNIVIKVMAQEYWDGFFQLKSHVESSVTKQLNKVTGEQLAIVLSEYASEGFNSKVPVYEEEFCIWAEAEVGKDGFIFDLEEFISENKDLIQPTLDDFYDRQDIPQDSDEAIGIVSCTNEKYGCGFSEGEDDISWYEPRYVNHADLTFLFYKKK